jgi:Signal transduction histidine kinase
MFSFNEGVALKFLLSLLLILIVINDFIRVRFIQNHESIWYYSSFILSNIIGAYFTYKVSCIGTAVYNVILMIDIIIFNGKPSNFLLIFNFIAFCIPYKIYRNPETLKDIFINYSISFIIVYIVRSVFMEKIRTEELNMELTNANSKLKEYSEKIEELTVAKERTRIAQELHDSIGHSLIALNMNLEYAENVVDLKPERAKEVINKAHNISKDCIVKLREVVSVLKEDNSIDNLSNAIKKLFENFYNNEKYKFNFKMDEDIENETPLIKSCIYKTIMESITNGIKHGDAEIFDVEIIKACDNIRFKISNNGLGCGDIKKSNGIKGIEKRIAELGGTVEFYSENKVGFTIDATIPVGGRKL